MPGWAGQSIGLHILILAQTNFPRLCLCSLNTGHSAWPSSGISRDSLSIARVFMREALCPGTKIEAFAFHRQLKLDLEMTGPGSPPLQPTNIKHLLCNSQCPRLAFYAGSVGRRKQEQKEKEVLGFAFSMAVHSDPLCVCLWSAGMERMPLLHSVLQKTNGPWQLQHNMETIKKEGLIKAPTIPAFPWALNPMLELSSLAMPPPSLHN